MPEKLPFTARERQVLDMILDEKTSLEIASELGISPRTVEAHRKSLLNKTGAKNVVGLVKSVLSKTFF